MKSFALLATVAAVFSLVSASAFAAPDAEAAQKYAKDNGCTKCHAVDKTKKGPPYTKTAAKFKGKADPEVEKQQKMARELSNAVEFGVHDYATFLATSFTPYSGEGN
mgnify:CR=1 FL=1